MGNIIVAVRSPLGKRAAPYRLEGETLIKRVEPCHVWRVRQAVGIDETVWSHCRHYVRVIRFEWFDGRSYELSKEDFERKLFPHGDGVVFARTLFVQIAELKLVRERPPAHGQLALALGA